ncbi:hypothetical protein B0T19DRAFT_468780 [Cercophora scortea]|uniref:Uncharacterized protein n=1 Tax=Cercophora scortea TaxID=314031 RepID=A0AAE0M2T8_9PEZI|nr:hypothetical protein B0T19DRAFT_468780 [Cercophora scortea]
MADARDSPAISRPDILVGFDFDFLLAASQPGLNHHPEDKRHCFVFPPGPPESEIQVSHQVFIARSITGLVEAGIHSPALGLKSFPGAQQRPPREPLVTVAPATLYKRPVRPPGAAGREWMDMRYDWLAIRVRMRPINEFDLEMGEVDAMFIALRSNLKMQIDHSCDFRVLVTHAGNLGLDLLTLKKTLTLVWLIEDLLFSLCAPYRRWRFEGALSFRNLTQWLTEDPSELGPSALDDEFVLHVPTSISLPSSFRARLNRLWSTCDPEALAQIVQALSFSVSVKAVDGSVALEFRMFEGTLDPGLAKMWAEVCTALVRKGGESTETYRGLLQKVLIRARTYQSSDGCSPMDSILADLGVHKTVVADWKRKRKWSEDRLYVDEPRPWIMDEAYRNQAFLPRLENDEFAMFSASPLGWPMGPNKNTGHG